MELGLTSYQLYKCLGSANNQVQQSQVSHFIKPTSILAQRVAEPKGDKFGNKTKPMLPKASILSSLCMLGRHLVFGPCIHESLKQMSFVQNMLIHQYILEFSNIYNILKRNFPSHIYTFVVQNNNKFIHTQLELSSEYLN